MLLKLPNELIYEILYFLPNYDLIETIPLLNKKINQIFKVSFFQENILFRHHPLTFNQQDNYCHYCNINLYVIDEKLSYVQCKHNSDT